VGDYLADTAPLRMKNRHDNRPRGEKRWVWIFAITVMLVTSLPYLMGYAAQGDSWRFTGFIIAVEDGNSYIAKMLSGAAGAWLFRTPYSTMEQRGVIAFLYYILLGKLSAPPGQHEQLTALFHLFRWVAGCAYILAAYDFLSYFVRSITARRVGLALATMGGGLGWLLVVAGRSQWLDSLPLGFFSPETFGFLELYTLPHLALARAALLWGLLIYLRASEGQWIGDKRDWVRTGLLWLVSALAQPLTAIIMGIILGAHWATSAIWRVFYQAQGNESPWFTAKRQALYLFKAALIPAPFLLYTIYSFGTDPFLRNWTEQNLILSPHPLHYLIAYGALLPLAVVGVYETLRQNEKANLLPVIWVLIFPALAYAPVNVQRRLPEGVWLALIVLALFPLERKFERNQRNRVQILYAGIFLLTLPTTLILILSGLTTVMRPSPPQYRTAEEIAAYQFLSTHAPAGSVVLAAYETGNALPAWTPQRVVIGHGPETIGLADLRGQVEAFFKHKTPEAVRQEFLAEQRVCFVYWGPPERALGEWSPYEASYLRPIYERGEVSIFEVAEGCTG